MTDPIADMLARIRNAIAAKHTRADIPASKLKLEIARILKEEGYIKNFRLMRDENGYPVIKVYLKYSESGEAVIHGMRRISKPGLRQYAGYGKISRPLGGAGVSVVSTSKGVITGNRARSLKVGGEVLCEVW